MIFLNVQGLLLIFWLALGSTCPDKKTMLLLKTDDVDEQRKILNKGTPRNSPPLSFSSLNSFCDFEKRNLCPGFTASFLFLSVSNANIGFSTASGETLTGQDKSLRKVDVPAIISWAVHVDMCHVSQGRPHISSMTGYRTFILRSPVSQDSLSVCRYVKSE